MTIKEAVKVIKANVVDGEVPQEVLTKLMADGLKFHELYTALDKAGV